MISFGCEAPIQIFSMLMCFAQLRYCSVQELIEIRLLHDTCLHGCVCCMYVFVHDGVLMVSGTYVQARTSYGTRHLCTPRTSYGIRHLCTSTCFLWYQALMYKHVLLLVLNFPNHAPPLLHNTLGLPPPFLQDALWCMQTRLISSKCSWETSRASNFSWRTRLQYVEAIHTQFLQSCYCCCVVYLYLRVCFLIHLL